MRTAARWPGRAAAVLLGLCLLGLCLVGAGPALAAAPALAAGATDAPVAPAPVQTAPGVPAEVGELLTRDGAALVVGLGAGELDLDPEERAQVRAGLVRTVRTWSPTLVAGAEVNPVTVRLERWIVPLLLRGAPVGVLTTGLDPEDVDAPARVLADPEFAAALEGLAPGAAVIHDEPLDAWFTLADGEVGALDAVARENLAGTVPVNLYQPLVAARYAVDRPAGPPVASESTGPQPVVWVALAAVALLVWAGVVVWLRRPDTGSHTPWRPPHREV
ncbi:MAG: hypothetical protein ACYC1Z_06560 [Georgenia sp.]